MPLSIQITKVMPRIKLKIEINLQLPRFGVLVTIFFSEIRLHYATPIS